MDNDRTPNDICHFSRKLISFYEEPLFYSRKRIQLSFSYMESRGHIRIEINPLKYQISIFWSLYKGHLYLPVKKLIILTT
jgi:hypothetical protein